MGGWTSTWPQSETEKYGLSKHIPLHVYSLNILHLQLVQVKAPDGQMRVNFDPTLHEVLLEAHHLSRLPLTIRMPPVIKSLMKSMNKEELRDRRASLELVMQVYQDLQSSMNEKERMLLHTKLLKIDTVNTQLLPLLGPL